MAEPTELILERLNRIETMLSRLDAGQTAILEELRAHKSLIAGALHSQTVQETTLAELATRLDRVEKRLDLRDQ